ncbi:MAG: N-6 DNA methylase [Veillonellaceae bacterium]|nr:N-6 DNA methylase [Veillonellaceae bacterium]
MPAPQSVIDLVTRFESQLAAYKSGRYNETELRRDFLDPFFEALGWDVRNTGNASEKYRDVIHESSVEIGGQAKSADYLFKIGETPAFFVEAKKPSVNIETDPAPAFQLKSYAWSKKLSFSILTDFEQMAFYECATKPVFDANPGIGRIALYHFKDYLSKWDEIAARISRSAVTSGAFETFVQGVKGKRGTQDVDDSFLAEMERWRDLLAHNIALRNPSVTQRELNTAVQTTIDRLIFLRICEDRGIEPEENLKNATDGIDVYADLLELFRKADKKYNSGLFHFTAEKNRPGHADTFTPTLKIDDKVFKDILSNLYLPKSPYRFNYFSADILGQVYERFLGRVIRLTPGHIAKVEEKPEVRKAGGVYYTPTYIVDYIVKNTVGELLNDKTPESLKITPLRILDPACGSGSFLLGAYQFLMDWYLDWYVHNDPKKHSRGADPAVIEVPGGWQLTLEKKKDILTRHIFGVDIDTQAVEVTKLSLLLKVVENPGQLSLFSEERILPDLAENIKCGNSLIAPDFYDGQQGTLFDSEEQYRVNAFDWYKEFSEVFLYGGFDAVIGNPPYGQVLDEKQKPYYSSKYKSTEGRFDTFELFIERGVSLCKFERKLGFIIPSPLLTNLYSRKLRKYLLDETNIHEITNFGMDVFSDPTIHTCIIVVERSSKKGNVKVRNKVKNFQDLHLPYDFEISQLEFGKNQYYTFDIFSNPETVELLQKFSDNSKLLGDICFIRQCIKTGNDKIYVNLFTEDPGIPWKPTLRGRTINRYVILEDKEYLKYGNWLARNWQNKTFYETPKIAVRETGNRIIATLDEDNRYFLSSLYAIYPKKKDDSKLLKYILGLLNSSVATYFIRIIALDLTQGAFTKFRTNQLARFPIHFIDFSNPAEVAQHDHLVALVETMLTLHKQLAAARLPDEKERLQRQITTTDRQIDQLVYQLYDLTPEEIAIVEGS